MDIKSETLKIGRTLQDAGIPYAFCGAIALAIHGYPRATKDIDILISEDDLDFVRKALAPCGFDLDAGFIRFDTGTNRARKIFRTSKAEGRDLLTLDLLIVSELNKNHSRGFCQDLSSAAILLRLQILSDLSHACRELGKAKWVRKARAEDHS